LLVLKAISNHYSEIELTQLLSIGPTGQYSRRLWFLIEWEETKIVLYLKEKYMGMIILKAHSKQMKSHTNA